MLIRNDLKAGTPSDKTAFRAEPPAVLGQGPPPSIAVSTAVILAASGVSNVLGVVRALWLARVMVPVDYGVWSLISTLLGYAGYADLGLNTGFILQAPRQIARGQARDAEVTGRQAFSGIVAVTGSLAMVLFGVSLVPISFITPVRGSLRIVATGIVLLGLANYYQVVLRIRHEWRRIGAAMVVTAAVSTGGVMAVTYVAGEITVEAVAAAAVAGTAAAACLLGYWSGARLAWPLDASRLRHLFLLGLPVVFLPVGFTMFQNLDRWIVAMVVPGVDLGYYGLGATFGGFLYVVPVSLATILFTRQIEIFGASGDATSGRAMVLPPIQLSGYVMAGMAGALALAMPFILSHLAPAYKAALPAATILVIGNCLLFGVPVGSQYLISVDRRKTVLLGLAAAMAVKVLLVALWVRTDLGVTGAAIAVATSDAVYCAAVIFYCLRLSDPSCARAPLRVLIYFFPFAICLGIAFLLYPGSVSSQGITRDGLTLLWLESAYVAMTGLLCLIFSRNTGFLDEPIVVRQAERYFPPSVVAFLRKRRQGTHSD